MRKSNFDYPLPIRILIAERFLESQARLEKLFSETEDMISVGIAAKGELAISMVAEHHPNIVILGIDLPGGVLTTIKKIRQLHPVVQVVVLGHTGQSDDKERVTQAGASGYLENPFPDETLLSLIRSLHHSKPQSPTLLTRMVRQGATYSDLQKRMLQSFERQGAKQKIRRVLAEAFEQFLAQESIVLTRPERNRLFNQIVKQTLQDMMDTLDKKQP